MARLQVQGFESLIRDTSSNGIINTNLKAELREIKSLITKVLEK